LIQCPVMKRRINGKNTFKSFYYFYKKIALSTGIGKGKDMANIADIKTGEGATIRKQNSVKKKQLAFTNI